MAGRHALSEDQARWLLVLAARKKSVLSMTVPRPVEVLLLSRGLVASVHGQLRTTPEGKSELLRLMFP